jgi:hypothetical protein
MTESKLQEQVADYLTYRYSEVLFHSDFGSGVKLTMGQAVKQKRQNGGRRAWPDIFIAEPINGYHGLFIELKRDKTRIKKRNGEWASEHIAEQANMLQKLKEKGYKAVFAVGFDQARSIIDDYLLNMMEE